MLPLTRIELDLPPGGGREQVLAEIIRDGSLDVRDEGEALVLTRRRLLGNRGVLRLLLPRCTARVTFHERVVRCLVRLDGLGVFMLLVMIGGVVVELSMDRTQYPRNYPPAFPFALAAFYVAWIAVEVVRTRNRLESALRGRSAHSKAI